MLTVPDFKQDFNIIFNLSQSAAYKPSPPAVNFQNIYIYTHTTDIQSLISYKTNRVFLGWAAMADH